MSNIFLRILILLFLITGIHFVQGQEQELTKEEKKENRKAKKQDKIAQGKMMITPLAGPAYTPELSLSISAGIMISFKTNRKDSLIQRSSGPIMLGASITGAYFFGTKLTTFWLKDKMRIYADINFKDMPDNYWGVGYEAGFNTEKGDSTTSYKRTWWQFYPKILWQFKKHFFIGPLIDFNYTKGRDASPGVTEDPNYIKYNDKPFNSGLGMVFQYDSRDVPVNAWKGAFVEVSAGFYGPYLGGDNTYQIFVVDLRKYWMIKQPGRTVAGQLKGRFGTGDVPYGEMSQPGTPFDLRGYTWGRYREESMIFALGEYRHMFTKRNGDLSIHGVVGWIGVGTLGEKVKEFGDWLPSIGIGYRLEVQPRMNLRIDIGVGLESAGFYFNFNEAF
ncbi:MAG: outer membrane protein assembly factor [Bacteroidales bacterium]|nr:outer membrane protein assembly factor [Bacteroidales bacterium]